MSYRDIHGKITEHAAERERDQLFDRPAPAMSANTRALFKRIDQLFTPPAAAPGKEPTNA